MTRFQRLLQWTAVGSLVLALYGGEAARAEGESQDADVVDSPAANGEAPVAPENGIGNGEPRGWLDTVTDTFVQGTLRLDMRLRAEIVEQNGRDTAQAYTERIRLGYGTKPFYGLSLYAEFEDTRSANEHLYDTTFNGEAQKAVVLDPESTELNQFFAKYQIDYLTAVAGRQRILLDDVRFIGNVGWRQNEQTYDAYTVVSDWIENASFFYSYIDDVNRILGSEASADWRSDSHLVNASYNIPRAGKLSAFGYFLDFTNSPANSSNTLGFRFAGSQPLPGESSVSYLASYAFQADAADNANDYRAHYYALEGALSKQELGTLGVGYEVLGSDDGKFGFRTPLATLHKFNGWADQFPVTPADGLEDLYVFAGAPLPLGINTRAIYHLFFSAERSRDFGGEFDAVASKAFNDHITVLAKVALFHGESGFPSNVQKYWVQTELQF